MAKIISTGIAEFLEENVKDLTGHMKWMEGRTLKCAESMEEVRVFIDNAIKIGRCVVDLETTGLNTRTKLDPILQEFIPIEKIVSFGLSYDSKYGLHVPINHQMDPELNLPEAEVMREIKRLCTLCITTYHNAKFDLQFLKNYDVIINDFKKFEDTQLLARLFDAGQKDTKLKHISERLLNQPMIEYDEIAPEGKFQLISPKIGYVYGASDAVCTLDLENFFWAQQIVLDQRSIYNLEKRVVFVVMEMEANLIKVDVPYLQGLKVEAVKKIANIEREIQVLAGHDFNVGSTQQLGKVVFEELKYRYPDRERTAGGQYKTDDKTLEKIADEYPIVKKIMEFRGLQKSLGTYIENLLRNHDENDCIKLGFHQSGTETGRFSSPGGEGILFDGYSGVNVQSIPKDTDGGMPDIRKAFIPRPGYKFVAADYENEEMRIATNLSNETSWIDAVNSGVDFHTKTASIITGKPIDKIEKPDRKLGKTTNFLALYLGGPMALAAQAKISMIEAKKILAAYFSGVPHLKKWIDQTIAHARKNKCVKTSFGRIRPLNTYYESGDRGLENHGDRCSVNTKVQGAAADIMKTVMVRMYNWIHMNNLQDDIRILITMHDELVFEIKEDKLGFFVPKIARIMMLSDLLQDGLKWSLPLTVDVKYGDSWRMKNKFFDDFPELKKNIDDPLDFHYSGQVTSSRYSIALGKAPDVAGDAVSHKEETTPIEAVKPPVAPVAEPAPVAPTEPQPVPVASPEPVKEGFVGWNMTETVVVADLATMADPKATIFTSVQPDPVPVLVPVSKSAESGDIDLNDILGSYTPPPATDSTAVPVVPTPVDSPVKSDEALPLSEPVVAQEVEQNSTEDLPEINEEEVVYTVRDRRKSTLRRLNEILTFLTIDEAKYESYKSPKKILRVKDSEGNSLRISEGKIPVDPFLTLARYFGI